MNVCICIYRCKRDDILQKRPIIWRSLLSVATPYKCIASCGLMNIGVYMYTDVNKDTDRYECGYRYSSVATW